MNRYVRLSDMVWPSPTDAFEVEHRLRYGGDLTQGDRLFLASICAAYRQLFIVPSSARHLPALRREWIRAEAPTPPAAVEPSPPTERGDHTHEENER